MAESTLTYTLSDFQRAVGHHLGYTRSNWSAEQRDDIDECVKAGEHNFYHPPAPEGEQPYVWSFLRPRTLITTVSGTSTYDLPDNFARMREGFTHVDTTVTDTHVQVVPEETIRSLQYADDKDDAPVYAAIRQKTFDATAGLRYEVVFYPTPDEIFTLYYRPEIHPDAMTSTNIYPMGGMAHSATLMEACLADAEQYKDDVQGAHTERFRELLRSSIEYDKGQTATEGQAYQVRTDADSLIVSIFNLYEQIGRRAGWSPAYDTWGYDEKKQAKFLIDAGLRMFYSPPVIGNQKQPHRWSFLRPEGTFNTVVDQEDYDLPTDFGGLDGDIIYSGTDSLYRRIKVVSPSDVVMMRSGPGALASGDPEYAAIRPKTTDGSAEQLWELLLYPNPGTVYTMIYHYHKMMLPLTETRYYPYGSREHGNTIIAAVLAQMEIHGPNPNPKRPWMQVFMEELAKSVKIDQTTTAQHLGQNRGDTFDYYRDLTPYRIKSVTYVP